MEKTGCLCYNMEVFLGEKFSDGIYSNVINRTKTKDVRGGKNE